MIGCWVGVIFGLYWVYIGVLWGKMEKKMETTIMDYMGGCQNYVGYCPPQ